MPSCSADVGMMGIPILGMMGISMFGMMGTWMFGMMGTLMFGMMGTSMFFHHFNKRHTSWEDEVSQQNLLRMYHIVSTWKVLSESLTRRLPMRDE